MQPLVLESVCIAIPILRRLHPDVEVLAVARFSHRRELAERLGAHAVLPHRPTSASSAVKVLFDSR